MNLRIVTSARDLTSARSIETMTTDMAFRLWRLGHRGASFAEFRASRLAQGGPRETEGNGIPLHERPSASAFRQQGLACFDWFRAHRLQPDMMCIDYGCGDLRLGQHFIEYLDNRHYLGLDVIDDFYRRGLVPMGGKLLQERQPRFMVISPDALARARAANADLIFSATMMRHMPPEEIAAFLGTIIDLMHWHSIAVIRFTSARKTTRTDPHDWAHSGISLILAVIRIDPGLLTRFEYGPRKADGQRAAALIIARNPARLDDWLPGEADMSAGLVC